jgi:general secretion pathway protein K
MMAAKNEKGMVLLLVLVIVALLASLVTEFAFSTLVDLRLTETFRDRTRAWYLAKGGVQAGRMILQENRNGYDHPEELWGVGIPAYPVGEDGMVSITIEDLDARMNVNRIVQGSNPNVPAYYSFVHLFTNLGLDDPQALADALIDWIDADDASRPNGAESDYYQRLEKPYAARNNSFDTVDELALVRGFTPEVLAQITPYIAVFGSGKINLNTASVDVLMAQAAEANVTLFDRGEAEGIVARRADKPFAQTAELNSISGLETVVHSSFSVKSTTFQINAEAMVNDGVRRASAIVDSNGTRIHYMKVD